MIIPYSMTLISRSRASAIVLAALLGASSAAYAQAPESKPPTAAPKASISEEAKEHFKAGVALLQDPEGERVEEAYREFKSAYEISGSAQILGNMGFSAMRLERDGEAIDAYSRYLREVPDIDPDERAQIVRDLQTLTVGVARFTLEAPAGAIVIDERVPVRGQHVTNAYGPVKDGKLAIGIRPGHHVFTAKLAGRQDAVWEVEAFAGGKEQHTFVLPEAVVAGPPAPVAESHGPAVGPIVVLAGGAAALVAAAVTGVVALNKTGDISDSCPNDVCPRTYDLSGERSNARSFVRVTDVLLLVGGVAVVAGGVWGYFAWRKEPAAKTTGFLSDWRLAL